MWLSVIPVFSLDQYVTSRRGGRGAAWTAASLVPLWLYEAFITAVYWIALCKALSSTRHEWLT
jgi:hypothetical protein